MWQEKKFKYQNADNTVGIILRPFNDGPAVFRIYGKKGAFKDYEIRHDDIRVKIMDDSVEMLESLDGEDCFLDYSRKILGQEQKYDRVKLSKRKNVTSDKIVEGNSIRYKTIEAFGKDLGLTKRQMELVRENKKLKVEVESLQQRLKGTNQIIAGEVKPTFRSLTGQVFSSFPVQT